MRSFIAVVVTVCLAVCLSLFLPTVNPIKSKQVIRLLPGSDDQDNGGDQPPSKKVKQEEEQEPKTYYQLKSSSSSPTSQNDQEPFPQSFQQLLSKQHSPFSAPQTLVSSQSSLPVEQQASTSSYHHHHHHRRRRRHQSQQDQTFVLKNANGVQFIFVNAIVPPQSTERSYEVVGSKVSLSDVRRYNNLMVSESDRMANLTIGKINALQSKVKKPRSHLLPQMKEEVQKGQHNSAHWPEVIDRLQVKSNNYWHRNDKQWD